MSLNTTFFQGRYVFMQISVNFNWKMETRYIRTIVTDTNHVYM